MPLSDAQVAAHLRKNLANVRARIAAAAKRAGRSDVPRLVAVTKYAPASIVRLLVEQMASPDDYVELGESRPQELWRKAEALKDLKIAWHLIGHLQTNKIRRTLPHVVCIESADSLRLLQEISREAEAQKYPANVLLEVNVSNDSAKHGFQPDEMEPLLTEVSKLLLTEVSKLPQLRVFGLMTMASLEGGPSKARSDFAALRSLRDNLRDKLLSHLPPAIMLHELSMGMSGDFEVAIEEGATLVRVGSALFEGIELETNEHEAD